MHFFAQKVVWYSWFYETKHWNQKYLLVITDTNCGNLHYLNEELIVGDIYRMAGTESSSSHEVKILNVLRKLLYFVNEHNGRMTKIAIILRNKVFQKSKFANNSLSKVGLLVQYSSKKI